AVRAPRFRALAAYALPFVDASAVLGLQLRSIPLWPYPNAIASWTLGLYVLIVALSALALRRALLAVTVAATFICEAVLLERVGIDGSLIVSSGIVLVLAGVTTRW